VNIRKALTRRKPSQLLTVRVDPAHLSTRRIGVSAVRGLVCEQRLIPGGRCEVYFLSDEQVYSDGSATTRLEQLRRRGLADCCPRAMSTINQRSRARAERHGNGRDKMRLRMGQGIERKDRFWTLGSTRYVCLCSGRAVVTSASRASWACRGWMATGWPTGGVSGCIAWLRARKSSVRSATDSQQAWRPDPRKQRSRSWAWVVACRRSR
jgi:hypothetical protein